MQKFIHTLGDSKNLRNPSDCGDNGYFDGAVEEMSCVKKGPPSHLKWDLYDKGPVKSRARQSFFTSNLIEQGLEKFRYH